MSISEAPGACTATDPVRTISVRRDPGRAFDGSGPLRWTDRQPWRDALTSVGLLCVALLFLEAVANILPDGTWFWLITPSRAVLILGLVAMGLVAPRPAAWRTWLDAPLLVLLLASLLASSGRVDSMAGWRWLLTEIGFFYLVVMVRRLHHDTHRAALVLALSGLVTAALVALQQAAAQTPTGFCRAPGAGMADGCGQPGALVRVIGTFANPNLLAAFVLIMLPLAWLAVDEWLNRSMRLAGWAVIALASFALVQTWSRAGIAAGVLSAVALFTLLRPRGPRLRRGGLLVVGGLAGAVGIVVAAGAGVRTSVWAESFGLAVRHPLGVGMGRSGALLDEAIPEPMQLQHAHNTWLNWLIEAGWLGFLAALAVTLLVCWRTWRSAREGSRIAAACGAGLLGVGLMSLADHPANSLRIALLMAFVIGLLMSSPLADQSICAGLPARPKGIGRRQRPGAAAATGTLARLSAAPGVSGPDAADLWPAGTEGRRAAPQVEVSTSWPEDGRPGPARAYPSSAVQTGSHDER